MSDSAEQEQWYFASAGQQVGPMTTDMLRQAVRRGQLGPMDLVWREGMAQWTAAQTLPQLVGFWVHAPRKPGAYYSAGTPLPPPPSMYYLDLDYAGFWLRFFAWIIDALVAGLISFLCWACFGSCIANVAYFGRIANIQEARLAALSVMAGQNLLVQWLYFALMESSAGMATVGKRAVGIMVTDERGERISFGHATGRFFAKFLSSTIFMIGYLMAGWTRKKQALHDMIAGTVVVRV